MLLLGQSCAYTERLGSKIFSGTGSVSLRSQRATQGRAAGDADELPHDAAAVAC